MFVATEAEEEEVGALAAEEERMEQSSVYRYFRCTAT